MYVYGDSIYVQGKPIVKSYNFLNYINIRIYGIYTPGARKYGPHTDHVIQFN